jgi:UDP-N-acetylglucosamine/UDP-N-acetylgalactosamine 4-epimerase
MLKKIKILITGGAGFIGSNLVTHFLDKGNQVVCLDNLSTGFEHNISHHYRNPNFLFMSGDIRDYKTCTQAVQGCDYVLHQAALGSVPRSIVDPLTTNSVNIEGFLNMLTAARDEGIRRFVYAASSSTYGDSKKLPKIEEVIGNPLSPYAVTKYVNELYANVYAKTYGMECIGLRYFNVFGKHQDPSGAYAAVIPLWVRQLLNHESPVINGDGSYSRDFTYIENVIHANEQAILVPKSKIFKRRKQYYNSELDEHKYLKQKSGNADINKDTMSHFSEVFNIAYGENTTLVELFLALRGELSKKDSAILSIEPKIGPYRPGDIPHSQASILKAKMILDYLPEYDARRGFELAAEWYCRMNLHVD